MGEALYQATLGDFMVRAALAGIGVAFAAGPLGCFVVWRRMAYYGDATAHSALLGVAIGLAIGLPIWFGALIVAMAMAFGVGGLALQGRLPIDSMLGVFSHAALALGVVAISLTPGFRGDLTGYLFGEILAVSAWDVGGVWLGALLVCGLIALAWRPLLNATISAELAAAEGGKPEQARLALLLAVGLSIAIAMQVVGLLLATSLLILPAATARMLARTPEAMALIAAGLGGLGVVVGLWASLLLDAPSGPMIVVALFCFFCAITAARAAASRP